MVKEFSIKISSDKEESKNGKPRNVIGRITMIKSKELEADPSFNKAKTRD
jgi:hypothetical protein